MPITLAGSTSNGQSDQTVRTKNYTVIAGVDRCVVVVVTAQNDSGANFIPGTPTFGGENMTDEHYQRSDSGIRAHMWMGYILETDLPESGLTTFSCTFNQEMNRSVVVVAQYDGVLQTDPFLDAGANTAGFSSAFSVAPNSDADGLVVDGWGDSRSGTTAMSTGTGQTLVKQSSTSVHSGIMTYEAGTGSPVTMNHTAPANVAFAGGASCLMPAPLPEGVPQGNSFFFSMGGLAIPAALGEIVVPVAEQIENLI